MTASSSRVVMISGASRGIGASIAALLRQNGWSLSLGVRQPELMQRHDGDLVCAFDALDPQSEQRWVDATVARFGRIDAVVHNAGIMSSKTILDADDDDFDLLFGVNVKSPLRLSRAAWPHLVASTGKVVTLASLSAKRVKAPRSSFYAMSKYAVLALAHGLRQCGKESGVRSTAICPGFVATDMAAAVKGVDLEALTRPEDVARIVHMVLELPPSASIAEIPVNWAVEDSY